MSQATFSVRMDDALKIQFETLCSDFGMNMSTAINVFAKAVVRERRIPFEITSTERNISREKALNAFYALREASSKNFPEGMSLDEINSEISSVRNGKADV